MKKRVEEEGEDESFVVVVGLVWFGLVCAYLHKKSTTEPLSMPKPRERERREKDTFFTRN